MNKVNLTPHKINILNSQGEEVEVVDASGKQARLDSLKVETGNKDGFPWFDTEYDEPFLALFEDGQEVARLEFPPEQEGTIFIVSGLFRSGFDRPDFWQPGELLRDKDGVPIGCIGLSR